MDILITNNPLVLSECKNRPNTEYIETSLLGILTKVRDYIHKGHKLLTHPLSGSIKPNETLYKSVLISEVPTQTDTQSVKIIEDCIVSAQKFVKIDIPEKHKKDLQTVDLSLIRSML